MDIEHKTNEYIVNYLNEVLEEKIFYLEDTYNRDFGKAIIVMYHKILTLTDKETGERYDILIVDDTIEGEIQLNFEDTGNDT